MTSLLFLGVALAVAVVGSLAVWYRHRERESSVNQSIETFRSEMGAIAPRADVPGGTRPVRSAPPSGTSRR